MSTGLHARRATGLTVAEREESFTQTESVARWSREGRAAYEAERSSVIRFYFYRRKDVPTRREIIASEGAGIFFIPNFSKNMFNFHCFRGAVPCCDFSFVQIKSRKEVCTSMHATSGLFSLDGTWSPWHLFASRRFSPNRWDHLFRSIVPHEGA